MNHPAPLKPPDSLLGYRLPLRHRSIATQVAFDETIIAQASPISSTADREHGRTARDSGGVRPPALRERAQQVPWPDVETPVSTMGAWRHWWAALLFSR